MILQEKYTLSNGVEIPKIGLGTWLISNEDAVQAVKDAVEIGYRHIDTAQAYGNEKGIGEGLKSCGIKRADLFITTKLAAEIKSYEEAVSAIDGSLKALGLDYLDMMIIHSPKPWKEYQEKDRHFEGNREAWRALEDAYKAGRLRAIGVSNFLAEDIKNITRCAINKC
jgi:diketogulonate reductase-like aldo/keto reductase